MLAGVIAALPDLDLDKCVLVNVVEDPLDQPSANHWFKGEILSLSSCTVGRCSLQRLDIFVGDLLHLGTIKWESNDETGACHND